MLIAAIDIVATTTAATMLVVIARAAARRYRLELPIDPSLIALVAVAAAVAGWFSDSGIGAASRDIVLAGLAVSAWTDIRVGLLFDRVLATCGASVVLVAIAERSVLASLLGAAVCGSAIVLLWVVTKGRGIGLGDAKLAALLGGILGVGSGLLSLGAAFVAGACYVVALMVSRGLGEDRSVAFGPFLAFGGTVAAVLQAVGPR